MRIVAVFALVVCSFTARGADGWNYFKGDGNGARVWSRQHPICGGKMQSPVNIDSAELVHDRSLGPLVLTGYDVTHGGEWTMKNNGHSVMVSVSGDITLQGAGLDGTFKAAQFHFHWGGDNERGSEHTVDGHRYAMEMHIVHYDTRHGSADVAADKPRGLAVLGILIEVGGYNKGFESITSSLEKIKHTGNSTSIHAVKLRDVLPRDLRDYFRYDGSLTTPPCYESVRWTVLKETVKISKEQMDSFRGLLFHGSSDEVRPMIDNFRPLQPIGDRIIYTSEGGYVPRDISGGSYQNWVMVGCACLVFFALGRFSSVKSSAVKGD